MCLRGNRGFSAVEILAALVVLSILGALSVRPITGLIQRTRMRTAADGLKQFIINVRTHAVTNPMVHCAVVFSVNPGSAPDSVWAFLDHSNPPNGVFDAGIDQRYQKAYVLPVKDSLNLVAANPDIVVFRGDGSANSSAKIVLKLRSLVDTIDILASTGRVKVIRK